MMPSYILNISGSSFAASEASESTGCMIGANYSPIRSPDTTTPDEVGGDSPYLQILEEPIDKFNFRYKTEVQGTHGTILGVNSHKSGSKTYPKVKLCNYSPKLQHEKMVMRCSLYTADINELQRVPHVHSLIKKTTDKGCRVTGEDKNDPHDLLVHAPQYTAVFQNMTIFFTRKKDQVKFLVEKERAHTQLIFIDGRANCTVRPTEQMVLSAEKSVKEMNLNVACLKFEAFVVNGQGMYKPVCSPAYSKPIFNMKSPEVNELKICRVDKCIGSCMGGEEVYIFVEKVNKKNIVIRFYEESEDSDDFKWTDLAWIEDVHHQFGIVFKTPKYKDPNITQNVKVYFRLERKTDRAESEPREFEFTPNRSPISLGKRPRTDETFVTSTVPELQTFQQLQPPSPTITPALSSFLPPNVDLSWITEGQNQLEVESVTAHEQYTKTNYANQIHQRTEEHFHSLNSIPSADSDCIENYFQNYAMRGLPTQIQSQLADVVYSDFYQFDGISDSISPLEELSKTSSLVLLKDKSNETLDYEQSLEHILNVTEIKLNSLFSLLIERKVSEEFFQSTLICMFSHAWDDDQNSLLHLVASSETLPPQIIRYVNVLKKYNVSVEVINIKNLNMETPLLVAAARGLPQMVSLLMDAGADVNATDITNNSALHLACLRSDLSTENVTTLLRKQPNLAIYNEDGHIVLHVAVSQGRLDLVSLLMVTSQELFSFSNLINLQDRKQGNTALHIATHLRHKAIVEVLLSKDKTDVNVKNFAGKTPLALVWEESDPYAAEIQEMLLLKKADPTLIEFIIAENESDNESEFESESETGTDYLES